MPDGEAPDTGPEPDWLPDDGLLPDDGPLPDEPVPSTATGPFAEEELSCPGATRLTLEATNRRSFGVMDA